MSESAYAFIRLGRPILLAVRLQSENPIAPPQPEMPSPSALNASSESVLAASKAAAGLLRAASQVDFGRRLSWSRHPSQTERRHESCREEFRDHSTARPSSPWP